MYDRRHFLRVMTTAGGGLLIGISFSRRSGDRGAEFEAEERWFTPNAFVEIGRSGRVRVAAPVPEVGQGVSAALPRLVAHELRVPLASVEIWRPAADRRFGDMVVAGSDAVVDYWVPLRTAGAAARELLVAAAAEQWGVPAAQCSAADGSVTHAPSQRRAAYGDLVERASMLPIPAEPALSDWPVAGPTEPASDPELTRIVRGEVEFGIDVRLPEMLFATVLRPPLLGARLSSYNAERALASPGVIRVVPIEPIVPDGSWYGAVRGGVAVIATSTWAAIRAREQLEAEWEGGAPGAAGSDHLSETLRRLAASEPERTVREQGTMPAGIQWIERYYELPLLAHGCMEPANFTASVSDEGCEAWGPTQNPLSMQGLIAEALGLDRDRVTVHQTRCGGGFGRRLAVDYGVEAAVVAQHTEGRPVQVVWTREDDVRHDYFRPPSVHRLRAALDGNGRLRAWDHHLATGSLARASFGAGARFPAVYDVQGADDFPLDAGFVRLGHSAADIPLQLGSFRSVAHSFNVFAVQSFLEELAGEAGVDPVEFRRTMLGADRTVVNELDLPGRRGSVSVDTGRMRRVLDTVAAAGPWARGGVRSGRYQGVAFALYKGTYVAHLAEVTNTPDGARVDRVVVAIDCGTVVDPNGVRAQAEGAVMEAIATVFHWSVPYRSGQVTVQNFNDYRLARASDAPTIETHIVPSGSPPSGVGEPPYPSAVPAIAIAIGRARGEPIRRLPLQG